MRYKFSLIVSLLLFVLLMNPNQALSKKNFKGSEAKTRGRIEGTTRDPPVLYLLLNKNGKKLNIRRYFK